MFNSKKPPTMMWRAIFAGALNPSLWAWQLCHVWYYLWILSITTVSCMIQSLDARWWHCISPLNFWLANSPILNCAGWVASSGGDLTGFSAIDRGWSRWHCEYLPIIWFIRSFQWMAMLWRLSTWWKVEWCGMYQPLHGEEGNGKLHMRTKIYTLVLSQPVIPSGIQA